MFKFSSALLILIAISTPAHADIFGIFASNGGPEQVIDGHAYGPTQSTIVDGSMHGYPFYSGCCEQKSPCCQGLWDGYCGSKGCGMKSSCGRGCGRTKGGCGCGTGVAMGYSYHGMGGKGGCGGCGSKGCDTCNPCAPKGCRWGLFDWMHYGRRHGCDACGGVGCSSCSGKGGHGKGGYMDYAPTQGYGESYHGTPTEAQEESTLQPPEVLVEPTSISDRSAWRRQVPTNPFSRPLGY